MAVKLCLGLKIPKPLCVFGLPVILCFLFSKQWQFGNMLFVPTIPQLSMHPEIINRASKSDACYSSNWEPQRQMPASILRMSKCGRKSWCSTRNQHLERLLRGLLVTSKIASTNSQHMSSQHTFQSLSLQWTFSARSCCIAALVNLPHFWRSCKWLFITFGNLCVLLSGLSGPSRLSESELDSMKPCLTCSSSYEFFSN